MSEKQAGNSKPIDPTEPFRGMRDAYLDAMSKAMAEAVNTDAYAQASGAMLDSALTISAPFREAMETSMLQVLQQLSLPSRQDIIALSGRFTNMEVRLDDLDTKLDRVEKLLQRLEPKAGRGVEKAAASAPHAEHLETEQLETKPAPVAASAPPASRGKDSAKQVLPPRRAAKKGTR